MGGKGSWDVEDGGGVGRGGKGGSSRIVGRPPLPLYPLHALGRGRVRAVLRIVKAHMVGRLKAQDSKSDAEHLLAKSGLMGSGFWPLQLRCKPEAAEKNLLFQWSRPEQIFSNA